MTVRKVRGAFSGVMPRGRLVASVTPTACARLPRRANGGDWVLTSETCALHVVGADFVREVQPGEIVIVDSEHGLRSERVESRAHARRSASSSSSTSPGRTA